MYPVAHVNVQVARDIQQNITGIEALLTVDSIEQAAIRAHCRIIRSQAAQEEANTGRSAQRLHAGVAKNKDLQKIINKLKVSIGVFRVVIFALVCLTIL